MEARKNYISSPGNSVEFYDVTPDYLFISSLALILLSPPPDWCSTGSNMRTSSRWR